MLGLLLMLSLTRRSYRRARPDEAVSWGKIRMDATPVKVYTDATLVFPFLVSEAFIPELERRKADKVKLRTN